VVQSIVSERFYELIVNGNRGTVSQMPQGDWGSACSWCHTVTDGFPDESAALVWLQTHGCYWDED